MSDTNNHRPFGPRPTPLLRAHKRAFILLLFYIPLVLIPWVITMLLVYRPAMRSYWTYPSNSPEHTSPGYSEVMEGFQWKDYQQQRGWARAIPIMNAFAAILSIPVTSTVLAQAAVVFAQRRTPDQQLSVRHLFSLADRAWLDWGMLHKMLYWHEAGSKRVKMFMYGGAVLALCGAIQYPLIQITVPWDQISVPSSRDTRYISYLENSHSGYDWSSSLSRGYHLLGRDLEPAQMANLPADLIVPHIVGGLSTIAAGVTLPSFWETPDENTGHRSDEYTYRRSSYRYLTYLGDQSGFVAALPADTTTGVLREHIMRLNSSVSCTNLTVSAWPSTCSGTNPFQASFSYSEDYYNGNMIIDVCAPGDMGKHPWTFSRNRQALSEEVFFRFTGRNTSEHIGYESREDDVVHCTAQTARGYFELGNAYNRGAFGPLLEKWSDVAQSHDYVEPDSYNAYRERGFRPSEEDTWVGAATPAPSEGNQLPGPLTTSLLALFGPSSWAANIANLTANRTQESLDSTSDIPSGFLSPLCAAAPFASTSLAISSKYSQWCAVNGLAGLRSSLDSLLFGWDDPTMVKKWLDIAVFVANSATLTSHMDRDLLEWPDVTGRAIYTAEGLKIYKPSPSIATQVILTLIVTVHVFGLLGVAYWLQRWPAWTRTLDSMAVARISAYLDPSLLPPLKTVRLSARAPLKDVDGLVGIQDAEAEHARSDRAGPSHQEGMAMETLSIASTAGKQATSSATPMMAAAGAGSVELGLGAPGIIAKRGKKQVAPSAAVADV